jgi:hypothetical protein
MWPWQNLALRPEMASLEWQRTHQGVRRLTVHQGTDLTVAGVQFRTGQHTVHQGTDVALAESCTSTGNGEKKAPRLQDVDAILRDFFPNAPDPSSIHCKSMLLRPLEKRNSEKGWTQPPL